MGVYHRPVGVAATRGAVLLAGAWPLHLAGPDRGWGELVCLCRKQSGGVGGSDGACELHRWWLHRRSGRRGHVRGQPRRRMVHRGSWRCWHWGRVLDRSLWHKSRLEARCTARTWWMARCLSRSGRWHRTLESRRRGTGWAALRCGPINRCVRECQTEHCLRLRQGAISGWQGRSGRRVRGDPLAVLRGKSRDHNINAAGRPARGSVVSSPAQSALWRRPW